MGAPFSLQPLNGRLRAGYGDLLIACAVAFITGSLYGATLLPDVGAGDIAEFQRAAPTLGLSHPTGYPLYMLLGWLWTHLPLGGTPAWRMNLLSAVTAAAANGALFLCARRLRQFRIVAVAVALAHGTALTFWKQATIAEVYTLAALLQAGLFLSLWRWREARGSLTIVGLFCGLALAHHRTALFLLPGTALFVSLTRRPAPRELLRAAVAFASGLLLYLYVPLRMTPELRSWASIWDYIAGGSLASAGFDLGRFLHENVARLGELLGRYVLPQLTLAGAALALLGTLRITRDRASAALLLTTYLCTLLFCGAYYVYDTEVFLTHAHLVAALLLGEGAMAILGRFHRRDQVRGRLRANLWYGPALLLLAIPLSLAPRNLPLVTAANRDLGAFPARAVLAQPIPPNALLVVDWWSIYEELRYLQQVEGIRPDIQLIPARDGSELLGTIGESLRRGQGVYLLRPQPALPLAQELDGLLWRVEATPARLRVERPLLVRWANGVTLTGYTIAERAYRSGEVVPLTLAWQGTVPLPAHQIVFIHLVGPDGNLWGQQDYAPAGLQREIEPGKSVFDLAGPLLRPDAPPGLYQVVLGWYDGSSLRRVALMDADGRPLATDFFTLPIQLEVLP